ncbi:MAG: GreA/GreB family elongation factor [Pirellulaceae bacterium]
MNMTRRKHKNNPRYNMNHNILVTHNDRRRLGTVLENIHAYGTERRNYLHSLETVIEEAHAIDSADAPYDVVTMNATVELQDVDTQETEIYTLVYPEWADISLNRISVLAPIGTAILGCRVGDVVEVELPSGRRRICVKALHYQPERSGDYHL